MIEVTCFHCGQAVLISPDVTRCAECGANLRRLIDAEQSTNYFYTRASTLADGGNLLHAVQEVQRGLAFQPGAELNLLGAILAKRLNRVDQMRQFVAGVPVDSPLRGEAEWLLRANQISSYVPVDIPTDADLLPARAEQDRRQRARGQARIQPSAWVMLAALLALGGWWGWQRLPPHWAESWEIAAPATQADTLQVARPDAVNAAPLDAAPATAPATAPTPAVDLVRIQAPNDADGAATPAPAAPLRLPTPTIALDLVNAPAAQPIAAAGLPAAAAAAEALALDLAALLTQQGRADLAALPVQARREGERLVLEGTVETAAQRTELEAITRLIPDITEISLVNVRVRLPATYTVQSGDSLWVISMKLYGAPDMVEEIFAANRNLMSSASTLSVGMVLAVPEKP